MGSFVGADANGANIQALTGVTWPTVQSGDLALLLWTFQNTLTPTDPTSQAFTLVATADDPSARSRLLKRVCTGSESGDISGWQCSGINRQSAVLYVVRGYSDVAGAVSFAETTTGTTHDCPQIGTGNGAANGDSILVGVSERLTSGTTNATAPTSPVTFVEHTGSEFGTGGSGGTYTGLADDGLATSQTMPFDPGAWSGHVSGGVAVTWTIALRPTASGTDLVVQNATQAQAADNVSLTQVHNLTVAGATQGQTAGNVTLIQVHNLAVAGATQAQAADNVNLNSAVNLTVQNAVQAQTAQQVTLTQTHNLAVQSATQAQAAGNIALTQAHNLTIQGAGQAQAAGNVTLTQTHYLTVAGATQTQISTTVTLSINAPYTPLIDPITTARLNLATATPRTNGATATARANPAEASS